MRSPDATMNDTNSGRSRATALSSYVMSARSCEIALREGTPQDVLAYIDGALLVDLWDSLVLPRDIRAAWSEVVDSALDQASHSRSESDEPSPGEDEAVGMQQTWEAGLRSL